MNGLQEVETRKYTKPPQMPGLPALGSALELMRSPLAFFVRGYHELGSVYRVRAANRDLYVLAGRQANLFMTQKGDGVLHSHELFGDFARELETEIFLVAMDGAPHRHLRGEMRDGYAREAYMRYLPEMGALIQNTARAWRVGETIPATRMLQRLVSRQLSQAIANFDAEPYFDALSVFLNTIMNAAVLKTWPRIMLKNPRYVRAKRRVMDMAREILRRHREEPVAGRAPDLIDDLLHATTIDGKPLSEAALIAATVGPMIAGIDTAANTLSFLLYSLLKNPDVLARVQSEVQRVPAAEYPTFAELKAMRALHGAALETLRLYPVAFAVPRMSVAEFEFDGYVVPKNQEVFVASGVTHYLPEFFPEPYQFDIDRYDAPRQEQRKAGVFVPYGLGAHTCLGAGMAELIIMFTTAMLLRTVELTLAPSDYVLRVRNMPLPRPDNRFGLRVMALKNGGAQ